MYQVMGKGVKAKGENMTGVQGLGWRDGLSWGASHLPPTKSTISLSLLQLPPKDSTGRVRCVRVN